MPEISIKCFPSIHDIPEEIWDGLAGNGSFFNTHRFIRSVEEAGVEEADFEYALFYQDDQVIGHMVLSTFNFNLDLFITESKFSAVMNKFFPSLMNIRMFTGGLPASLGQSNMVVHAEDVQMIIPLLAGLLDKRAEKYKARFISIKELTTEEAGRYEGFKDYGFEKVYSIPYMMLNISWTSFEAYLASMRHLYRRNILRSLKKIGLSAPEIYQQHDSNIPPDHPVLVLGDVSLCSPEQFHALYLDVMNRASVKLETLNAAFFERLFAHCRNDLELLVLRKGDQIISAALLVRENQELTFMLVGREEEKDAYDSYYNLVYGIIAHAINTGAGKLNLGQTSYCVKQRIGGIAEQRYVYFKATGSLVNKLIKRFHPLIFPQTPLPGIRVFHEVLNRPAPSFPVIYDQSNASV